MPPTPPPHRGLSTRHFAWIFGGLLLLLTIYQLTQHRPQRFEPPPSSTSAEIGYDTPPAGAPADAPVRFTPPTPKEESAADEDGRYAAETTVPDNAAPDLSGLEEYSAPAAEVDADKVYTYVEQMPQPPGGMEGLVQYLAKNVRLPAEALRNQVEGKVFVRFIVRPDGHLANFAVIKGLGSGLDEEAVRVLRQMPAWTPGKQNGRPVSVSYTVPVTFAR